MVSKKKSLESTKASLIIGWAKLGFLSNIKAGLSKGSVAVIVQDSSSAGTES